MTDLIPFLGRHRTALVLFLFAIVGSVVFLRGHLADAALTADTPPTSPRPNVPTTDRHTGRTASTLSDGDEQRATYVPTTRADASPEQRTRTEIDITVRGFIRGWALPGSVAERRAALEAYVSTPTMLDAFALTDPTNVPDGGLANPPVIAGLAPDSATVLTVFRDSSSVTIHVVRLAAGWRVYQVDHG